MGLIVLFSPLCVYLEIFDKKKLLKPIKQTKKECEKYMEILIFSFTLWAFLYNLPLKASSV